MKTLLNYSLASAMVASLLVALPASAGNANVESQLKNHFGQKSIRGIFNKEDWHFNDKKFTIYVNSVESVKVSKMKLVDLETKTPVPDTPKEVVIAASLHFNCSESGDTSAEVTLDKKYTWGHETDFSTTVSETTEVEADIFDGEGMIDVRQSLSVAAEHGSSKNWTTTEAADVSDRTKSVKPKAGKIALLKISQTKQPEYIDFSGHYIIPDDAKITMRYIHKKGGRKLHHTNDFSASELRKKGVLPDVKIATSGKTKFTSKQLGESEISWYDLKPEFVRSQCDGPTQDDGVDINNLKGFFEENVVKI